MAGSYPSPTIEGGGLDTAAQAAGGLFDKLAGNPFDKVIAQLRERSRMPNGRDRLARNQPRDRPLDRTLANARS